MDKKTLSKFKKILEAEHNKVLESSKTAINEWADITSRQKGDEADEAQAMSEAHLSVRLRERERQHLNNITAALQRINDGSFGECMDCGDEIGIKRLEIRPMTTLCIHCKEQEEKREGSYSAQV